MKSKAKLHEDFDEPLLLIYDPRFPVAAAVEQAVNPLADFDRPMAVVDTKELASLLVSGCKVEFL